VRSTLEPRLGVLDVGAIVVSNVIGGGIFFVPQIVTGVKAHAEQQAWRPEAGGA
jgi:amino acid transporter